MSRRCATPSKIGVIVYNRDNAILQRRHAGEALPSAAPTSSATRTASATSS